MVCRRPRSEIGEGEEGHGEMERNIQSPMIRKVEDDFVRLKYLATEPLKKRISHGVLYQFPGSYSIGTIAFVPGRQLRLCLPVRYSLYFAIKSLIRAIALFLYPPPNIELWFK